MRHCRKLEPPARSAKNRFYVSAFADFESTFENAALVREPRNERLSVKFQAAHTYIREFSARKLEVKRDAPFQRLV